ncbi:MAG: DHH family phosphoesterase [Clostridia bacterium]|nr:DHH family phosphoesterase [Clostridia bacterium]
MKELLEQLRAMTWRKSVLCAIASLAVFTVISAFFNPWLILAGLLLIAGYVVCAFLLLRKDTKSEGLFSQDNAIIGTTLDFVSKFRSPVIIVNKQGMINWYNSAFVEASGSRHSLYGKSAAETINASFTPARIEQLNSGATFFLNYNDVDYEVSGYALNSGNKSYCIVVLADRSELVFAKKELAEKNAVVAFIMLDNIGDSVAVSKDQYRSVSARVARLSSEWTKARGGSVTEYDRDKYVVVFEEKHLSGIVASKFDILDSIRETEVDESSSPITASIGISNIPGSFAEKEAAARAALELALQRGGDQAVLRTDSSTEYYGGKTKTVQKKTKIRSRVVAGELSALIEKSSNVIVMGHKFCDHDSIASCVAAARIATTLGKQAKIVVNIHDVNLKPIFSRMRGLNYYYELFTDAATAQDMINSDTLLIICDVNNPDMFESKEIYDNCMNYLIIDHHRKVQEEYAIAPKLAYIEPSVSSASELLCEIAEYALPHGGLTKIESELLFAGIILDTNNFRKNTGVGTFSAALFLRSLGADPIEAQNFFRTNLDEFMYEADIENNISIYRDRMIIATTKLDSDDASQTKLVSSKSADRLLSITGVDATFVLARIGANVNISARSGGAINVQLILESLGGGGHFDAAGALLRDVTIEQATELLQNAIDSVVKE